MISRENYSGNPSPDVGGETEFYQCNFSQPAPVDSGGGVMIGVRLWSGDDTPRTFTECNLTNCEPPPGSTLNGCVTAIATKYETTTTDTITVDGYEIVLEHHSDFVHGRWTDSGYVYDPVEIERD